jgi:hypothetical protein
MKKILFILFLVLLFACRKVEVEPTPPTPKVEDIFSVKEASIGNGDPLRFTLKAEGVYTLTLFDSATQQVVTRERIIGKIGENSLKLYTKSLPVKYLYLSLKDVNGFEIGKTLLVIN